MKTILRVSSIVENGILFCGCGGDTLPAEKGAFCLIKSSNAFCALPGPYKPVPVGTSCSCTHHGAFGFNFEVGVVINP